VHSQDQQHTAPHAVARRFALALSLIVISAALISCGGSHTGGDDIPPPMPSNAGKLDVSFGAAGLVEVFAPNRETTYFSGLRPLPGAAGGGYLLAGAWETSGAGSRQQTWFATKLDANGAVDTTYGTNGMAKWERTFSAGALSSILVDPQGRALLIGQSCVAPLCGPGDFAQTGFTIEIRRFNPNGTPDLTYGTNGQFSSPGHRGGPLRPVMQSDGQIVIATSHGGGAPRFPVTERWLRVTADGHRDPAFPDFPSQQVPITYLTSHFEAPHLIQQPDGKLVNGHQRTVSRFTADGQLDASFDGKGWTVLSDDVADLVMHPAGGYMALGRTFLTSTTFARSLFSISATGAFTSTPLDDLGPVTETALVVQPDGRTVIVGNMMGAPPAGGGGFFVTRRLINGTPDTGFAAGSPGNMAIHGLGATVATGAVHLDSAGRIIAAGHSGQRIFMLRYLP
jgi:uncharacterized delta-60 repeat protein